MEKQSRQVIQTSPKSFFKDKTTRMAHNMNRQEWTTILTIGWGATTRSLLPKKNSHNRQGGRCLKEIAGQLLVMAMFIWERLSNYCRRIR